MAPGFPGYTCAMKIYSKRNALIGSLALFLGRRYARKKLRGASGRLRFR